MGDVGAIDFGFWCDFVTANIDEACGFEVDVDAYRFGENPGRDCVLGATNDQEDTIREALMGLWDGFCNGAWDAAFAAYTKTLIAAVVDLVGDDGTGDLGAIVRQAIGDDTSVTARAIADIVREARADAAAEAE